MFIFFTDKPVEASLPSSLNKAAPATPTPELTEVETFDLAADKEPSSSGQTTSDDRRRGAEPDPADLRIERTHTQTFSSSPDDDVVDGKVWGVVKEDSVIGSHVWVEISGVDNTASDAADIIRDFAAVDGGGGGGGKLLKRQTKVDLDLDNNKDELIKNDGLTPDAEDPLIISTKISSKDETKTTSNPDDMQIKEANVINKDTITNANTKNKADKVLVDDNLRTFTEQAKDGDIDEQIKSTPPNQELMNNIIGNQEPSSAATDEGGTNSGQENMETEEGNGQDGINPMSHADLIEQVNKLDVYESYPFTIHTHHFSYLSFWYCIYF